MYATVEDVVGALETLPPNALILTLDHQNLHLGTWYRPAVGLWMPAIPLGPPEHPHTAWQLLEESEEGVSGGLVFMAETSGAHHPSKQLEMIRTQAAPEDIPCLVPHDDVCLLAAASVMTVVQRRHPAGIPTPMYQAADDGTPALVLLPVAVL